MIEICGWIGSLLLALRAIPQLVKSIRTKSSKDISRLFLIMWIIGNILSILYVIHSNDIPLLLNFSLNTIIPSIILGVKLKYD